MWQWSCWDDNVQAAFWEQPGLCFWGAEILTPAQLSRLGPRQVLEAGAGGGTLRAVLVARPAHVAHVGANREEIPRLILLGQGSKPQPGWGRAAPWQPRKASLAELPTRSEPNIPWNYPAQLLLLLAAKLGLLLRLQQQSGDGGGLGARGRGCGCGGNMHGLGGTGVTSSMP